MPARGRHRHEERPAFQDLPDETLRTSRPFSACARAHPGKPSLHDVKEHARATTKAASRSSVSGRGAPPRARRGASHGGARRDRTDDLLLAKQALSQLSYGPGRTIAIRRRRWRPAGAAWKVVGLGRFELPTSPLSGVRSNRLSYRPAQAHPD